jgi:hypothetical protein
VSSIEFKGAFDKTMPGGRTPSRRRSLKPARGRTDGEVQQRVLVELIAQVEGFIDGMKSNMSAAAGSPRCASTTASEGRVEANVHGEAREESTARRRARGDGCARRHRHARGVEANEVTVGRRAGAGARVVLADAGRLLHRASYPVAKAGCSNSTPARAPTAASYVQRLVEGNGAARHATACARKAERASLPIRGDLGRTSLIQRSGEAQRWTIFHLPSTPGR